MPGGARKTRGRPRRWTAAALCLASLGGGAASAAPPADPVAAKPAAPAPDRVVVDFPAHWRSGILTQSASDYLCPGGRRILVIASDLPRGGTVARPTTVGSIEIDGKKVNATVLGAVNDRLRTYAAPPSITPECVPGQVRLHIFHLDKGAVSNSQYVDIWSGEAKN